MAKPSPIPLFDAAGAAVTFPLSAGAAAAILGTAFVCPAGGKIVVSLMIVRGSTQAVPQIVQNGAAMDLNIALGGTMNSGAKYDFATGVQIADTINFQMSAATSLSLLELNFVEDQ